MSPRSSHVYRLIDRVIYYGKEQKQNDNNNNDKTSNQVLAKVVCFHAEKRVSTLNDYDTVSNKLPNKEDSYFDTLQLVLN